MHHALTLPEILGEIFAYNYSFTTAQCARVSKSWSEVALDQLWRSLNTPLPLFKLLAPMWLEDFSDDLEALSDDTISVSNFPAVDHPIHELSLVVDFRLRMAFCSGPKCYSTSKLESF